MNEPAAEPHYLVIGPIGTPEGPYTVDLLRERLRTGRLTQEDRYLDAATQAPVDLLAIVPDVAELIREARRRTSDRIRRRSSDRHAAVAEAVAASSAREPAAVVASSVREPAGAPEAAPPVLPRRPSTALGGRSLLIAVVAAVVIAVAFGFVSSLVETAPNLTPTVQFLGAGRWTVDLTATAAVGAEAGSAEGKARQQEFQGRLLQGAGILTVDLHAGDATIRTKDDSSFHHWEPLSGNGRTLTIRLLPAHPLLGERVTIRDDGDNRILTLDDQGVVLVLRPQTP